MNRMLPLLAALLLPAAAVAEDLRTQPAAVDERLPHARTRELFQVTTRLAEHGAAQSHRADGNAGKAVRLSARRRPRRGCR